MRSGKIGTIGWKTIITALVVLYILLTAGYILYSQFAIYENRMVQEAYLNGRIATIEELLDEAEGGCTPFPIYAGERQVELINVACLLAPEEAGPPAAESD